MSQLQLFRQDHAASGRREPDLAFIRKSLGRQLRLVRDAEIMPWSEDECSIRKVRFPELAAMLPADEAETLTSEFLNELARLRSAEQAG